MRLHKLYLLAFIKKGVVLNKIISWLKASFSKASAQDDANGQFGLGTLYHQGFGVPQDYAEAMRYYRKAATKGHKDAHYNIAMMLEIGEGVQQNTAEARKWYEAAANLGDPHAAYRLGLRLRDEPKFGASQKDIANWFRIAADANIAAAQLALAHYLADPENVEVFDEKMRCGITHWQPKLARQKRK